MKGLNDRIEGLTEHVRLNPADMKAFATLRALLARSN